MGDILLQESVDHNESFLPLSVDIILLCKNADYNSLKNSGEILGTPADLLRLLYTF